MHRTVEPKDVAKTQKTFYINDDLARLVAAFQDATGTSFTRVMSAAVLQYLFANIHPDANWMRFAMAVERGDVDVGEVRVKIIEGHLRNARDMLAQVEPTVDEPETDTLVKRFRSEIEHYEEMLDHFNGEIAKADNPMDAAIAHFSSGGLRSYYRLMDEIAGVEPKASEGIDSN